MTVFIRRILVTLRKSTFPTLLGLGLSALGFTLPALGDDPAPAPVPAPAPADDPWAAVAALAATFPGPGESPEKTALEKRPIMKAYYAKNYPQWTDPEPPPVPDGKLRNLSAAPMGPRFPITDKTWPANPGDADICLWEDDKLAAYSFSIDDNNAQDVPFWEDYSRKNGGLNITWNLISGKIDGDIDPQVVRSGGTTDLWKKVLADGFHIASHSVEHVADPVTADGWPGPGWEAAESLRQIDAKFPGHRTKLFAYPGTPIQVFSVSPSWRPWVIKYYAAARGFSGNPINQANQIDYFNIHTTALPERIFDESDPRYAPFNFDNMLTKSADPKLAPYFRGWATTFIHGVGEGKDWETNPHYAGHVKVFAWVAAHRDDLWVGFLDDVALYGEERDTATLTTTKADATRIELHLTSQMDPTVFNYPLTVKVRLPSDWKGVNATQGDKTISADFLPKDGQPYALIHAIPDEGVIILNPASEGKAAK